jgi:short subunit dehydrogenase-like uncharacterized protein
MASTDTLLIYGSYGYTGDLVVQRALGAESGPGAATPEEADGAGESAGVGGIDAEVVLAGRTPERLEEQAVEYDCPARAFTLEHSGAVERNLEGVDAVLNCAGPFVRTADPLVDACLATGTDYLDITGEIDVFESLATRDAEAEGTGATLLPGVGFDVVPTDCLAAHLADALPDATRLAVGFQAAGSVSPGTLRTAVESIGEGGAVRREGRITGVPTDYRTPEIDFGRGPTRAVTIPWGDVATAYRSTGVPNVEVYAAVPDRAIGVLRATDRLAPLLAREWVRGALSAIVDRTVIGPDPEERERGAAYVWGEITEGEATYEARLTTPEPYALTALTAVESARRALAGDAPDGYQTPSTAFGADYVTEFAGVERADARPVDAPTALSVGERADGARDQ